MLSWDIFCTVIDNYGDIGVTWRLARQLAHERQEPVRLASEEPGSRVIANGFVISRPPC